MPPRWSESACLRCGLCVGVCPFGAIQLEGGRIIIDPEKCRDCNVCVRACPVRALRGVKNEKP